MDERTIYSFGGLFVATIAFLAAFYGKGSGGRSWAVAWLSLVASGASRTFVEASPILVPAFTLLGSGFSLLLVHGAWRFTRGDAPLPQVATAALLFAIPLRMALYPVLPELGSRALGAALCTLCVGLSCMLLLRPPQGRPSASARALGFAFPTIAAVSWIDSMMPLFGFASVTGTALWFAEGVVIAAVKISAFVSMHRDSADALHEELAAHYREMTESATDLFAELSADGMTLYANPAHKTVLGVDPKDLIGTYGPAVEVTPLPPDLSQLQESSKEMLFVARNKEDGRPVTLECSFHRVRHASGEYRTVVTSRDITARAARERDREDLNARLEALVESRTEELRTSLLQLQEANRLASLGTMAAGIAHQINNPVGSIQMSAEFALSTPNQAPDRDATWKQALENSVEQAKRCGNIVTRMLQFARNEPTKKSGDDLSAILRRACDTTEGYARERNATIESDGLNTSLYVRCGAIELEQAFLNIIRNACEASDLPHSVSVSARREDDDAKVTIRDDGRGIPANALDHVLNPFFTTRLDAGGTGLGLSVAHGVIADHDGTLEIDSALEKGTTVTVTLPLDSGVA